MQGQNTVQARIKMLEGNISGLLYRLHCLDNAPIFLAFNSISEIFNLATARTILGDAFHAAVETMSFLKRQITEMQRERSGLLELCNEPAPEFTLAR